MLVALIDVQELTRGNQTLETEVALLILRVEHSRLLVLLTKHLNGFTILLVLNLAQLAHFVLF